MCFNEKKIYMKYFKLFAKAREGARMQTKNLTKTKKILVFQLRQLKKEDFY